MPGVPSGRGCDACRVQKKKCDQAKPSCSRCARLQIICKGAGQQRFIFKQQAQGVTVSRKDRQVVSTPPSNEMTVLGQAFLQTIKVTTDLRYNLAWSYGGFLEEIPSRLGRNEALDTSVDALVASHANFCSGQRIPSTDSLVKYSRALNALKDCLDEPEKACTTETLCAVMLLLMSQSFNGINEGTWTKHSEGAAQMLKVRGWHDPKDDFENKLLLSLRGPVLFEGIFNPRIQLSSYEWKMLIENHLDGRSFEGRLMRCLARVPDFMQRGKEMIGGDNNGNRLKLVHEMNVNYDMAKTDMAELRNGLSMVQQRREVDGLQDPSRLAQTHCYFLRSYGLALAFSIILNRVLSAVDMENAFSLDLEAAQFGQEIMHITKEAVVYRPLAASWILLFLSVAWVATEDPLVKSTLEEKILESQSDFAIEPDHGQLMLRLEEMSRRLYLLE